MRKDRCAEVVVHEPVTWIKGSFKLLARGKIARLDPSVKTDKGLECKWVVRMEKGDADTVMSRLESLAGLAEWTRGCQRKQVSARAAET